MRPVTYRVKLAGNIIAHPTMIGTLASIGFNPLRTSWDAKEPWWNPRAIRFLQERATNGAKVFEWGSGSLTVWLHSLGLSVISIESDAEWADKVQAACPDADIRLVPGQEQGDMPSRVPPDGGSGNTATTYFDRYVSAVQV